MTHFALAFKDPGGLLKEKDVITLIVVHVFNFHATIELLFKIFLRVSVYEEIHIQTS